jgi:predicted branched-subunit amino acid permease
VRSARPPRSHSAAIHRQALAIGVAVGLFGLSFGVLAAQTGLSLLQAAALSTLVFVGSSQLAAVGVAAEGGTAVAAVLGGLLLSARSVAFGVTLAPLLRGSLRRRLLASQLIIDESAALAAALPDPTSARRGFVALVWPRLDRARGWRRPRARRSRSSRPRSCRPERRSCWRRSAR